MNDGGAKPGEVWDPVHAKWVAKEVDYIYDVACQVGEGKPIYTGMYKATSDEAVIELACKMMGVTGESAFTVFDVFRTLPDGTGVLVVRESKDWPRGVSIIRSKGITVGGRGIISPQPAAPHHPSVKEVSKSETVKAVATIVATEKSIPRVSYTLKQAV